jgi:hypothetical protein
VEGEWRSFGISVATPDAATRNSQSITMKAGKKP